MPINVVLFAKRLFCLILYLFCAIEIAHHIPVFANSPTTKSFERNVTRSSEIASRNSSSNINSPRVTKSSGFFSPPPPGNYVIPVVVHIISKNPDAITDQKVIDGIKDLNDAFAHAGVYAVGPGANTGITFCLSKIDPDGGITNGITRTQSVLGDFDKDVEDDLMKNLVSWDPQQYCNIWLVDSVESEIIEMSKFRCGTWSRFSEAGYSGLYALGDFRDGIVTTSFGTLLAHETGHYLGLLHTFIIGNCANTNCSVDGDKICDTPPQSTPGGSCANPQNSCTSDTASGFTVDVPDLNSNFMSYSGACTNSFTAGQAAEMRDVLNTSRSSLTAQNKCNPPCGENILARFTRDNWQPSTGNTINFTSTTSGATNYQWSIDGIIQGGNSTTFSKSFAAPGKYKVTLKAYNASANCFSTYSDFVIVSCGVMSRFYPDKRLIASKDPYLIDTIHFTNRSIGATSYKWTMSNDQGMNEQVVSTDKDLSYPFKAPGKYSVRLIAANGGCTDTTKAFVFDVEDATPDGTMGISSIQCYQQTKIKISFSACNSGYATMTSDIPVSFYDGDPRTDTAKKIGSTYIIRDSIKGICCTPVYDTILDIHESGLNQLFAVFNDNGIGVPVIFPNSGHYEKDYTNNIKVATDFQFKVKVAPVSATMEPGDTLQLSAVASPDSATSIVWSTAENLSCTDCSNPLFVAGKHDATKQVKVTSEFSCMDSTTVDIKVPPADDFVVSIDSMNCSRNDSMLVHFTVCNNYKRPVIPKDLKVAFYDGDPANTSTKLLGPVFINDADVSAKCNSFIHTIKNIDSGKIYAVVNDNGIQIPVTIGSDSMFLEKDYSNNTNNSDYLQDTVRLSPADTLVAINQSLPIKILSTISNPASVRWATGDGYAISCTDCAMPLVTVKANSVVQMEMENPHGCLIKGQSRIKILPPDMTVQILSTSCFTNDSLLVKFELCMHNDFDSVLANIPVSFYENDPSGKAKLLEPIFYTATSRFGNCDTFSAVVRSPSTQNVYAVVNDKGDGTTAFEETDLTNNSDNKPVVPFQVTITPADTTVFRPTPVQLFATVTGGQGRAFHWQPAEGLSCYDCASPIAKSPYSVQYEVEATNEHACTTTNTASIKTYTGGKVNIPNGFTPNADGHNDVFYVMGSTEIKMLKDFSVFNRWGQKVFQVTNAPANDPNFGWKGFINGKQADAGSYVYFVRILFTDGSEEVYKGTVTLIR